MIDAMAWMDQFLQALEQTFGDRIRFVGLQGSYGRGEATERSDLDPVVILDDVAPADIRAYDAVLDTLPHREKLCGFFGGQNQLLNWDAADLFQFYYDTAPVFGSLDGWLPRPDGAAADGAIKMGACAVYHGCIHNMLYDKSEDVLRDLYKSASFTVRAICFRQTGAYVGRKDELMVAVSPREQGILGTYDCLKNGGTVDFESMSGALFAWAKYWIEQTA